MRKCNILICGATRSSTMGMLPLASLLSFVCSRFVLQLQRFILLHAFHSHPALPSLYLRFFSSCPPTLFSFPPSFPLPFHPAHAPFPSSPSFPTHTCQTLWPLSPFLLTGSGLWYRPIFGARRKNVLMTVYSPRHPVLWMWWSTSFWSTFLVVCICLGGREGVVDVCGGF